MGTKTVCLSREELYALVWEKPMTKLAQEFGFSDNGLRKICKKHNIPLPNLGYWTKKAYNKKVKQPPLPPIKNGEPSKIYIEKREKAPSAAKASNAKIYPPKIHALIDFEMLPENKISVLDTLVEPHPLIRTAEKCLTKGKPSKYNLLEYWEREHLAISVSKDSLDRALRIMDAVIKAFVVRKFKVSVEGSKTFVQVMGEKIQIGLKESVNQKVKELTPKEKKERERDTHQLLYSSREYEFTPNGKLTLYIQKSYDRQKWSDGVRQNVEPKLNAFIIGLIKAAQYEKDRRIQKAKDEEERRKQERQRAELSHKIYEEEKRVEELLEEVSAWTRSQQMHKYIEAVHKSAMEKHGSIEQGSKLEKWLIWAQQQAERLDPLCDSPPSVLDRKSWY